MQNLALFKKRVNIPGLITRIFESRNGLWFPEHDCVVEKKNNIFAVLSGPDGKRVIPASNIVTDAGDQYYAQLGAGEAATETFDVLVLGTAHSGTPAKSDDFSDITEIAASEKAHDTGYPQTNDGDADNSGTTGVDVVTFLTSYTKGDFNATGISHGTITNATPAASEPVLTMYAFASSFDKTSDDTLKVFTNHQMNGV